MFQKQKPNFGVHFKTFIVMATICPLGRPLGWKTPKKTYFEILWGGPRGEIKNKHGKNQKNIFGISLGRTPWRKPNKLCKKQKTLETQKKHILRLLAYPPPSPRLLENCFFFIFLFLVFPLVFIFSMFFGQCFLVFPFFWCFHFGFPMFFGFSNIFFGFLHGALPKEFPNIFPGFFQCLFLFSSCGLPQRISKNFFLVLSSLQCGS